MIVFERLTSRKSWRHISHETYRRLIRAMKPDIEENLIDAYWMTIGLSNKEDELGIIFKVD